MTDFELLLRSKHQTKVQRPKSIWESIGKAVQAKVIETIAGRADKWWSWMAGQPPWNFWAHLLDNKTVVIEAAGAYVFPIDGEWLEAWGHAHKKDFSKIAKALGGRPYATPWLRDIVVRR